MTTPHNNDGGTAFPGKYEYVECNLVIDGYSPGMSLRDWFAGMALQGVIAGSGHPVFDHHGENQGQAQGSIQLALIDGPGPPQFESNSTCSTWACIAYYTADAMLAARKAKL
jgi:hypothetical protein